MKSSRRMLAKKLSLRNLKRRNKNHKQKQKLESDYVGMEDESTRSPSAQETMSHGEEDYEIPPRAQHVALQLDTNGNCTTIPTRDSLQNGIPRIVETTNASSTTSQHVQVERIAKAAAALDNYGNTLFEQGEYDNAMASYTKALRLKTRTLKQLQTMQEEEQVQNPLDHSTTTTSPQAQDMLASVATSMNNIGYLRQRSGAAANETMAAYQDALQIKQKVMGRDSLSVGKTLNNIGSVHFLTRDFDKALQAYQEACDIMSLNLGPNHVDVATVYSNMGDVHLARGNVDICIEQYRHALEIRWAQLGEHDAKVIRLLEKIALIEMGNLQEAQAQINKEIFHNEQALDSHDDAQGIPVEFDKLLDEVKRDIHHVDTVQRQLALDMVKSKLQMRREMRALEEVDSCPVEILGDLSSPAPRGAVMPLTPVDRTLALEGVKARLKQIRESRNEGSEECFTDDIEVCKNHDEDDSVREEESLESHEKAQGDLVKAVLLKENEADSHCATRRAMERHVQATENVKKRLERLRQTKSTSSSNGAFLPCTSQFGMEGIQALRQLRVDDNSK